MNKIIAFAMTFMMILASTISAFGAGYTDVKPGNWAFDAVNIMSEKAIVKGYPDGSFKPGNTVTYGEFIKMALIADTGEDAGNAAAGHWASNYYNKALELKYFTQYDIDKSQLGDKITRSDMALIISAILGDVKITDYDKIQEGIEDITYQTPHEYDITKAYAYGILTGYTDNTFRPEKTLSRAESATAIYRLVDESKRVAPGKDNDNSTGTKIEINAGKTYSVTSYDVTLGYNGVEKIEVNSLNRIVIFSKKCHEVISVYIDNNKVSAMGFTSGLNYYKDGEYYIYMANAAKHNVQTAGEIPTLMFDDIENVYKYTDVKL